MQPLALAFCARTALTDGQLPIKWRARLLRSQNTGRSRADLCQQRGLHHILNDLNSQTKWDSISQSVSTLKITTSEQKVTNILQLRRLWRSFVDCKPFQAGCLYICTLANKLLTDKCVAQSLCNSRACCCWNG